MPTSNLSQLQNILELIVATNPQSLLDVGVGFGKYGFLAREYLEFWDGREQYAKWKRRFEGVEAFPDYLTPVHRFVYDHIHIGNALDVLPRLNDRFDLILLIDVIEHFPLEQGRAMLEECRRLGRNIIVSTPIDAGTQGDAFNNPYEAHVSQWYRSSFDFFPQRFFVPNDDSIICYAGEDAARVRRALLTNQLKAQVKRRVPFARAAHKHALAAYKKLRG